jgi:hypothetical protein
VQINGENVFAASKRFPEQNILKNSLEITSTIEK